VGAKLCKWGGGGGVVGGKKKNKMGGFVFLRVGVGVEKKKKKEAKFSNELRYNGVHCRQKTVASVGKSGGPIGLRGKKGVGIAQKG